MSRRLTRSGAMIRRPTRPGRGQLPTRRRTVLKSLPCDLFAGKQGEWSRPTRYFSERSEFGLGGSSATLGGMTKGLRICSRSVVALFAVALIVWLLILAPSSKAPQVTLQFKAITNSVSLGQVARFTLTNHGKHPVQRLPLYVVEFQDREKNDEISTRSIALAICLAPSSSDDAPGPSNPNFLS